MPCLRAWGPLGPCLLGLCGPLALPGWCVSLEKWQLGVDLGDVAPTLYHITASRVGPETRVCLCLLRE